MANCVISHHLLKRWGLQPFHAGLWSLACSTPLVAVVNGVGTLYSTAWDCALKTVAAEGPMALYKGALPCRRLCSSQHTVGGTCSAFVLTSAPFLPACPAGCTAHFLRAGPHTVLTLLLLDRMQKLLGLQPPGQQQQRRLAGGPKAGAAKATA